MNRLLPETLAFECQLEYIRWPATKKKIENFRLLAPKL